MKVLQVNQVCGFGSTGRIVEQLSEAMNRNGIQNEILYGYGKTENPLARKFGSLYEEALHKIDTRIMGHHGLASKNVTRKMLQYMDEFQPDLIHLHNLHGFYLNIELLFKWLKEKRIPVIWTLHDCWTFTGHCAHFDYMGCSKWKTGCGDCPDKNTYPRTWHDASTENWQRKKSAFSGLQSCALVTPSQWLKEFLKDSFLNCYPVQCIPNGISLTDFHPVPNCTVRKKGDKKIVLASAANLYDRKGGQFLPEAAKQLGCGYEIWVLGLKKKKGLPDNLIPLPYLRSTTEKP